MSETPPSRFLILYIFLGILDLLSISFFIEFRWLTKPLILLSLIWFYNNTESSNKSLLFQAGLFMALLGDIFLINDGQLYFLLGLGSFLVMQLCYSLYFIRNSFVATAQKWLFVIFLFAVLGLYMNGIWEKLGEMVIPVLVYSTIIVLMASTAILRSTTLKGYWSVVVGAIFFIISDGLIAWNSFIESINQGGILIMATYIIAQYLIVNGVVQTSGK